MGIVRVHTHCPAGTSVRVYLDGQEGREIRVSDGQRVQLRIVQDRTVRPARGELLAMYLRSAFSAKQIRYGLDIPSPFYAELTGSVCPVGEEDVSVTLVCNEGHYAILADEGSVINDRECREFNADRGIWALLLGLVLLPLVLIYALGLIVLWSDAGTPLAARIGFSIIYSVAVVAVTVSFLLRIRSSRHQL